ncbi:MAG: Abi family protein [Alphaproteobacteria bacterium]|nr:Abi family protein [Alphaproteobacteria bacterium]
MTVSRGTQLDNAQRGGWMQAVFLESKQRVKDFRIALSEARFKRYLDHAGGNEMAAIMLYHWNCSLAQSLYFSLHMWEISLRNRLNAFLCWKYNADWPYDNTRAVRNLAAKNKGRLADAIERQERQRNVKQAPTGAIVADLSVGFWVSLLGKSYDNPYSWRYNIARIFPNDKSIDRASASKACDLLLDVRNRVAHHEPIFHLKLEQVRKDLDLLLGGMNDAAHAYTGAVCTFWPIWKSGPQKVF